MIPRPATGRRIINLLVSMAASVAASTGIFILLWITLMLAYKGLPALNLDFFINLPTPPMVPGGGLANAILGTLLLTVLATLMAVPIGLAGRYLPGGISAISPNWPIFADLPPMS